MRWRTDILPGRSEGRLLHHLSDLTNHCPAPRVLSVAVRTALNGWATKRRFQSRGHCARGGDAEDSVEHYARRRRLWDLTQARLRLSIPLTPAARTSHFLGLDRGIPRDDRIKLALLVYASYSAQNPQRHIPVRPGTFFPCYGNTSRTPPAGSWTPYGLEDGQRERQRPRDY